MTEPAVRAACHDEVCITCSDAATVVRVLELLADDTARVDTGERIEAVSVGLVEAAVGDLVLVHAGVAIGKLREAP